MVEAKVIADAGKCSRSRLQRYMQPVSATTKCHTSWQQPDICEKHERNVPANARIGQEPVEPREIVGSVHWRAVGNALVIGDIRKDQWLARWIHTLQVAVDSKNEHTLDLRLQSSAYYVCTTMKRIPEELLDHIFGFLNDAELFVLACTSWQWRDRVSRRQTLWRRRFKRQFPQHDDNEREWLCQYRRALAASMYVEGATSEPLDTHADISLDWFDAYGKRRTTEYRWRSGEHTIAWHLERLNWSDTNSKGQKAWRKWHLHEYLVIGTTYEIQHRNYLYVWRLDALYKPPCTIDDRGRWIQDADARGDWLIVQCKSSGVNTLLVYNLVDNTCCADITEDFVQCCILRCTADSLHVAWIKYDFSNHGPVTVTYRLQHIVLGQEASLWRQVDGSVEMHLSPYESIHLQRVDDNRLAIWTNCRDALIPDLALLEVTDDTTKLSLKIKWSHAVAALELRPIVSRGLLGVRHEQNAWKMLSLGDGSEVHLSQLDCWRSSGLYPLESQWLGVLKNATWRNPKASAALGMHNWTSQTSTPTASLYNDSGKFTIVDYTAHASPIKRPPGVKDYPIASSKHCTAEKKRKKRKDKYLNAMLRKMQDLLHSFDSAKDA
ncbi:hypothetical protein THASP1DRAFT_24541 [Thamnocephalis sphaerospora]|uniref:F-box domain-containing protein n=1 Tax=Thamnocephalis sphaerospora TaxID=78915 RepID=A0A4P9XN81_9FUNG|nr:hypothetical protein THASP1DRAFT_24541 [Thamnocephalis sphaerospora]|eukprot:RKP07282.1 hypothetical protein THASP1DRAFT_24541 [Thamnocephalis sphaerospora]